MTMVTGYYVAMENRDEMPSQIRFLVGPFPTMAKAAEWAPKVVNHFSMKFPDSFVSGKFPIKLMAVYMEEPPPGAWNGDLWVNGTGTS